MNKKYLVTLTVNMVTGEQQEIVFDFMAHEQTKMYMLYNYALYLGVSKCREMLIETHSITIYELKEEEQC